MEPLHVPLCGSYIKPEAGATPRSSRTINESDSSGYELKTTQLVKILMTCGLHCEQKGHQEKFLNNVSISSFTVHISWKNFTDTVHFDIRLASIICYKSDQ